ncbi:MAG: hypothetical protein ACHQY2_05520 [Candidatus Eremiobacterales bacterium]
MQAQAPVTGTFRRAWELLAGNWIVVVPAVIVGIVTGVVLYLLDVYAGVSLGGLGDLNGGPGVFSIFIGSIVAVVVRMLGAIVSIAYTTGMAAAAWQRGRATLADGTSALRKDGTQVFIAILLLFLIGSIAAFLMDFLFYLPVLLYAIFVLYTIPGVIVGERTAVDALVESFRLAGKNFWATTGVVALIIAIAAVAAILGGLLHGIPLIGSIFELVVMEVVVAYATLVVVGEYIVLRPTLDQPADAPPPAAS